MYILSFFICCVILSLGFLNKSMLSILLISEILLVLIFLLFLLLCAYHNIYFLAGFSFVLLTLGGLELALGVLLFML